MARWNGYFGLGLGLELGLGSGLEFGLEPGSGLELWLGYEQKSYCANTLVFNMFWHSAMAGFSEI